MSAVHAASPKDAKVNIFISSRSEDRGIAEFLGIKLRLLSSSKLKVFISSEIPGGRTWKAEIHDALRSTNIFLLLYTSPQSDWIWCMYEAAFFSGICTDQQRSGTGHLISLVSPFADIPPSPLADLQAYTANQAGIEQFLIDLLEEGKFTDGKAIADDIRAKRPKEFYDATSLLADQMNLDKKTTDYFEYRITITPSDIEERDPSTLIDRCSVDGSAITMSILGLDRPKANWTDLRSAGVTRSYNDWIQDLESKLRRMVDDKMPEPSRPTGVMTPFYNGQRRFLPVLSRVERIRGRPSQVSVIFIELSNIAHDEFDEELRRVPPDQVAIIRLLNLARSFRWDVINPFFDFVEQQDVQALIGNPDVTDAFDKEFNIYRSRVSKLTDDARRYNLQNQEYVRAVLDMENEDVIRSLWRLYFVEDDKLNKACRSRDFGAVISLLKNLQCINKKFFMLCLDRYLVEAEKMPPRDLTIGDMRAEFAKASNS